MGKKSLESNLRLFEFKTIGYYLKLFENNKAEKITVHFFSSKKWHFGRSITLGQALKKYELLFPHRSLRIAAVVSKWPLGCANIQTGFLRDKI